MTVEWAIKYSNNHGGEVVGPYELSNDRRKSVDAYTNFMGDSYEQTDQSLIKTRSWSNFMREFPEDITNSQLQGWDRHFENIRKAGDIEIPQTVPQFTCES